MVLTRQSAIVGMRLFRSGSRATIYVATVGEHPGEPFSIGRSVDSFVSAFGKSGSIPSILLKGRGTDVGPSVIRSVPINVVDQFCWPLSGLQVPDDAMRLVSCPSNRNRQVAARVVCAGGISWPGAMNFHTPEQPSRLWLISKHGTQLIHRHRSRSRPTRSVHPFISCHRRSPQTFRKESGGRPVADIRVSGRRPIPPPEQYASRGAIGNPSMAL